MSAATATRPLRRRSLERTGMTPEQELELLIVEQQADDTYYVDRPGGEVSLDAPVKDGDGYASTLGAEFVGRDPWGLVDDVIGLGLDPAHVAYRGDLVDATSSRPGVFGSGLADPRNIPHGTAGGYQNHKCKCGPCTTSWATYKRERRAAKRAEGDG